MEDILKIFLAGLTLANGPCLFTCAPIILPCITGLSVSRAGSPGYRIGLRFVMVFSVFRMIGYAILGFLSVVFYRFVFGMVAPAGIHLRAVLGLFVAIVGVVYLFYGGRQGRHSGSICGSAASGERGKSLWHIALFGLLVGFSPCPPLLAVLTYIAATSANAVSGMLLGATFGLGTIITPLIPLALFAGLISEKMERFRGLTVSIRFLSALILIYFGGIMIFR